VISVEYHKFFPPTYVTPQLKGFPLELGTDARSQQTRMMGLPDGQNSFTIGLAIYTIPACEGRMDGHRTMAKTALCRALCG